MSLFPRLIADLFIILHHNVSRTLLPYKPGAFAYAAGKRNAPT